MTLAELIEAYAKASTDFIDSCWLGEGGPDSVGEAKRARMNALKAEIDERLAEAVVEHAILMSGGGMHVRPDSPGIEHVYPLAEWIEHNQRFGGKVYTRTVVVVEDWREAPRTP